MYYSYLRVSTQSQVEQNGTQMQEDVIRTYCEKEKIKIESSFVDEGISGTRVDRDGLMELLATVEKNDNIIVQNTSRLWRGDYATAMIKYQLKKIGANVISIEQPTYNLYDNDPTAILMNGLFELLDQYDKMQIAMKLSKGRKAKAKKGKKACGSAPFGYRWEDAEIVVDYNNNLIVKDIFENYLKFKSLATLQSYCLVMNYKTSQGNNFSKQSLANMLSNDFYIGVVTHADKKYEGTHEAIISKTIFDEVQAVLKKRGCRVVK